MDAHGTVHYAERCPDDVQGESLELDEGPTEADVLAAEQRAQRLAESRAANEARVITCLFVLVGSVSGLQFRLVRVVGIANAPRMSNRVAGFVLHARLVHRSGIHPFDLHVSTSQV